jgi:hypothetical protein
MSTHNDIPKDTVEELLRLASLVGTDAKYPELTNKTNMKETLLQRCQREAREKFNEDTAGEVSFYTETINEIIANTLKQAAEEVLNGMIISWSPCGSCNNCETATSACERIIEARTENRVRNEIINTLTDAQKLLLGENNENDVCS